MNRFIQYPLIVLALLLRPLSASVVINEIHYHPDSELEAVEFIELFNTGDTATDVSGWSFSEGIDHVFPSETVIDAGAYYILALDESAYNRKFGSIFNGGVKADTAWDSGSLSNSGETLTLRDSGNEVADQVDYQESFPWAVTPDGGGASLELIHPAADNDLAGHWRASAVPTPGKENSGLIENTPPAVRQVEHLPMAPTSEDAIVVRAKASDSDGVASMILEVQAVLPGQYVRLTDEAYETGWEQIVMKDTGEDGDEVAEDAVFAATIPNSMVQHRSLIRYRILAEDTLGQSVRLPYDDDPTPNRALFVYDGVPAWTGSPDPGNVSNRTFTTEELTILPVYHLLADEGDVERSQYQSSSESRRFLGTMVYEGIVYDHIEFKIRGEFSTYQSGKNKWKFFFNRGSSFQARDNYGIKYPGGFRVMNFSACASPWVPANRGMSGLDESTGFRLQSLAGALGPKTHHLHFRVIDDADEAPSGNQYGGDLWGLYLSQENPDGRFLSRVGLPDGSTFKIESGSPDQKHQGPVESDYSSFISQARRTQTAEWWHANMNMSAYYSFRAINRAVGNIDIREGWNHFFYHRPNGQWQPVPWDLDMTFMPETHWSGTIDAKACLNTNEIAIEYANRCRELLDLLLSDRTAGGGQVGSVVEETAQWLGTRKEWIAVEGIAKQSALAEATTSNPHGYATGDTVTIAGVSTSGHNGPHEITVTSATTFTYAVSIFTPNTVEGDAIQAGTSVGAGSAWAEIDLAMWNEHPRSTGGHQGNFYANPTTQGFRGGTLTRTLTSPDFAGFTDYVKDFATATDPDDFAIGDGDQRGYGYNYVRLESEDGKGSERPSLTYTGTDGFPVDGLRFTSGAFVSAGTIFDPQSFAGMQWRLGEIYNASTPNYEADTPWRYEITPVWESDILTEFEEEMVLAANVVRPGSTYRVRVRHLNQLGGWSHWSEPIEFVAGTPDLSSYQDLVISEIMYHPGAPSEAELAAGYRREDFEFIELYNRGNAAIDLTNLRFTKGVDFDFGSGTLAPGDTVIVVSHLEAFTSRYGGDLSVAGQYSGQLANGGERLKLSYGAGTPLIEFTYDDKDGWPTESDGDGNSLVRKDNTRADDLSVATSWSVGVVGGTPGSLDAAQPAPIDTDQDGQSDEAELLAGTDPNDALSVLQVTNLAARADTALEITWASVSGKRYGIDFTASLSGGVWESLAEVTATGESTKHTDGEPARTQSTDGYYRIRVVE